MSRYIDANKLIEMLRHNSDFLTAPKHSKDGIIDEIVYQPTADVVEVRHGYWEFKNTTYCHYGCFCSVCGQKSGIGGIRANQLKPYCPNCGAKMDGERREE